MIQVVLWDVDNTLLSFQAAEKAAVKTCFSLFSLGECTDEMVAEYSGINNRYWQMLERGEMTKPRILVDRFGEFFRLHGIDPGIAAPFNDAYQIRLGDTICFFDHALETVQALRGRVLQCAVTNGTKIAQDAKLAKSGLDKLFDHIFISDELGAEKPSPAFFTKVFQAIGSYPKERVMIVGDSLTSDMKGGRDAGIVTCWYNPRGLKNETGLPIDHEITDIAEVPGLLF